MIPLSLYEEFRAHVLAETPVALATIIEGPGVGAKLMVSRTNGTEVVTGSLGHPDLDRVVARDTAGELEAGRTGVRHYGPEGQATPRGKVVPLPVRGPAGLRPRTAERGSQIAATGTDGFAEF